MPAELARGLGRQLVQEAPGLVEGLRAAGGAVCGAMKSSAPITRRSACAAISGSASRKSPRRGTIRHGYKVEMTWREVGRQPSELADLNSNSAMSIKDDLAHDTLRVQALLTLKQ